MIGRPYFLHAFISSIALLACDGSCSGEARPASPAADFFPLQVGDRWRMVAEPGGATRNYGVTAHDGSVAFFHGTAHTYAERMTVRSEGVELVSPEGSTLAVLLHGPIRPDHRWEYSLTERDVAIPCRGRIAATGQEYELGGQKVGDCVTAIRHCDYPAGTPFPRATKHRIEDLWCAGIGLAQRTQRFDPPPPVKALPPERTERLVGVAAAGASWHPQDEFGCHRFILLPSDLRAVCGPDVQVLEPFAGHSASGVCRYRYASRQGPITVEANTNEMGNLGPEVDTALAFRSNETSVRVTQKPGACPPNQLMRLEPLLRSLLR